MNRATIIYICVLTACAAGLWIVISLGDTLVPCQDLAGRWKLENKFPAVTFLPYGPNVSVEQSGSFFQMSFEHGPKLNLKLIDQKFNPLPGGQIVVVSMQNGPWTIIMQGKPDSDDMALEVVGATPKDSGKWAAHRTLRTFPAGAP